MEHELIDDRHSSGSWPTDVPAASFAELQRLLRAGRFALGIMPSDARMWWQMAEESRGRPIATMFLFLPALVAVGVVVAAIWTSNWSWVVAAPLGFLTMFFGSPENPAKGMAVLFGVSLLAVGWLGGWSSLLVSGVVVLVIYVRSQAICGLGARAFQKFVFSDPQGFEKYWSLGLVMLRDEATGHIHKHNPRTAQ